jgi:hypothetical protein
MVALAGLKLYRLAPALTLQTSGIFSIALRVVCDVGPECVHEDCKGRAAANDDGLPAVSIIICLDLKVRPTNRTLDHTPDRQPRRI